MPAAALALESQTGRTAPDNRAAAEARLEALRWPRRGPVCPHCGARHVYRMICTRSGGVRFKCACCRKPFSARRGTVLERSNIHTAAWLRAMALFLDDPGRGLPARIQRACAVSYKTAWSMTQRLMAAPDDPVLSALRDERDERGESPPCHPDPLREDRRLP
ncbi:transposase [Rhodospira trueperi]|uniref:Transposase zinc-ribbon domain-containing protein n=1 Tax=Rhodospira trueperi TaxID=69960 RepID=A0A1G7CFG0_9PROT|nr:transposase [Rhodospira trueperi]SDE38112.1 Transposase zinc-ribbon domain-containing protein [Rhodospira trueperi]